MLRKTLPQLIDNALHLPASDTLPLPPIAVGSPAWFIWLDGEANQAFSAATPTGSVTVRRERQGSGLYWYAYQRHGPKLRKVYLGKTADITLARLHTVFQSLAQSGNAASPDAGTVYINVFGTPQLMRGTTPVELPASKAVALLAYLALASAPQSRDHLLALLWPESAEEAARKNLRNVLWNIRALLGDGVLLAQGERLGIQPGVSVDVREFERLVGGVDGGRWTVDGNINRPPSTVHRQTLQDALELYRGPLLLGLSLVEAADFDLWLTAERERLAHQFSRAAEQLIAMLRVAGESDGVIAVAQRVLSLDPLQEWPYRALMEAHAHRGDRATALRQYDLLRAMLDRELDATPAPETEAIHDAIVRGAFERSTSRPLQRPPVRMTQASAAPFVGRSVERGALDSELVVANGGTVRMVVMSGEMGIGKSRLWQVWAAGIDPNTTVLEARCLVSTQPMPFAPLIALFSQRIVLERFAASVASAQAAWVDNLSPLLPTLGETVARPPLLSRLQPEDERHRVFEAFVQALQAIAPPPLVLFLDDLQWADTTTLDWLDYLVHRGREMALLLVLAYRSEDAPRPLLQRIAQWDRDRLLRRLPLERLNEQEAVALLDALRTRQEEEEGKKAKDAFSLSPALPFSLSPDAAQLYGASAGNPFFLTELAAAPSGDLPPALADLVRAKIDRLPEIAQHVVQAAAVLEPDVDTATIWRIAGRDEDEILDALDALLHAAILIEQSDRYLFAHPFVATIVRDDMSRARRATLHRRAATALEQLYVDRLPAQAGRIMAHFREAGDARQMARYAEVAGDYALTVAAPAEATAFYNQAIASEATAARLLGLGRAQIWRGDLDAAADALQQAMQRFSQDGDPAGAALTALQLADLGTMQNQYARSMQLAQQALALAGASNPSIAAAAHVLIATGLRIGGAPLAEAETHLNQAIRIAGEINLPDVLTYCHVGLCNIRAERGDIQGAFEAAEAIVRYAKLAGNDFYQAVGYNNAAHRALLLGNFSAAHANLEAGLHLVEERALEVPRQWLYSTRGELALAEHDWDAATDWFGRGVKEAERNHNNGQVAMYHANLGLAARGRGHVDEAIQLLEQARTETALETAAFQQTQIDLWLAETYLQHNQHADADAALGRVEARLATGSFQQLHPLAKALRLHL